MDQRDVQVYPTLTKSLNNTARDIGQILPRRIQGGNPPPQQPVQQAMPQQPQPEDPNVARFRKWLLYILSGIVGGAAVILIVWRIVLKFI